MWRFGLELDAPRVFLGKWFRVSANAALGKMQRREEVQRIETSPKLIAGEIDSPGWQKLMRFPYQINEYSRRSFSHSMQETVWSVLLLLFQLQCLL
jgi:hypothetical protein